MTTPYLDKPFFEKLLFWADKTDNDRAMVFKVVQMLIRLFLITIREFKKNDLSLRSGALTFTIMLSLVPMLAMSTAIIKGLGGGDQLRKAAYSYVEALEQTDGAVAESSPEKPDDTKTQPPPQTNLTKHLRLAIDQLFDYVDNTNFAALGTIGVIGILLSVLLVLTHIESAMNVIWKVSSGRSILRKIADYLTLLVIMPLSINIAFAASAFLKSPVLASKMAIFIPASWIQNLLLKPLPIFFIALSFYALYMFFTSTKVKTIPALIGAILAAILWFAMQNIYISLQLGVANYNAIYGSFATLPLFLVWIYLGWIFILTGAQLAFACQHLDSYRLLPPLATQPSHMLGAAYDIMDNVYKSFSKNIRLTRTDLIKSLESHYPKQLLEKVVDRLQKSEFVYLNQNDDRILPTHPIDLFEEQDIIDSILGSDSPETDGGQKSLAVINAAKISRHNRSVPPQS